MATLKYATSTKGLELESPLATTHTPKLNKTTEKEQANKYPWFEPTKYPNEVKPNWDIDELKKWEYNEIELGKYDEMSKWEYNEVDTSRYPLEVTEEDLERYKKNNIDK